MSELKKSLKSMVRYSLVLNWLRCLFKISKLNKKNKLDIFKPINFNYCDYLKSVNIALVVK